MPAAGSYFVYIVASPSRTIYIGVTNDLVRRVHQHKEKEVRGFTATYNVSRLVWFEEFATPSDAIAREKQLKNWTREKKISIIESVTQSVDGLSAGWDEYESERAK
jgi:putative endonuclease